QIQPRPVVHEAELERLIVRVRGLAEPSGVEVGRSQVVERGLRRPKRQGLLERGDGLAILTTQDEQTAQVGIAVRQQWGAPGHGLELADSRVDVSVPVPPGSKPPMRPPVVWPAPEGGRVGRLLSLRL